MKYIDTLQEKKLVALEKKQLKESMHELARVLSASNAQLPQELVAELGRLSNTITSSITELRNDTVVPDRIAEDYQKIADYVVNATEENTTELKKVVNEVVAALKAKNLDISKIKIPAPVVNVPAPVVNVPVNDFSPIEEAIKGLKEEEGIHLEDYKAHDLVSDEDVQYIGFVNLEGSWYIIENKVKENSLRYLFGKSDYKSAFSNAASYKYKILSEAVNAL